MNLDCKEKYLMFLYSKNMYLYTWFDFSKINRHLDFFLNLIIQNIHPASLNCFFSIYLDSCIFYSLIHNSSKPVDESKVLWKVNASQFPMTISAVVYIFMFPITCPEMVEPSWRPRTTCKWPPSAKVPTREQISKYSSNVCT